jgi:hypothetical protein
MKSGEFLGRYSAEHVGAEQSPPRRERASQRLSRLLLALACQMSRDRSRSAAEPECPIPALHDVGALSLVQGGEDERGVVGLR